MTAMESLNAYFRSCPLLAEGKFPGDMCAGQDIPFTLEGFAQDNAVQRYVHGDALREATFVLTTQDSYPRQNLQGLFDGGFQEQLQAWLQLDGNLPALPQGMQAQSVITQGAMYQVDQTTEQVRYQVQCKLVYFKGGNE